MVDNNSRSSLFIVSDNGYYLYPEFSFSVPEDRPDNNDTNEPDMLVNITQSFWSYW